MQIEVSNLHKSYYDGEGHKLHILKGLNFKVISGSTVAIVGASGYGGLQLVKLIAEHPIFDIAYLGGNRSAGKNWNETG